MEKRIKPFYEIAFEKLFDSFIKFGYKIKKSSDLVYDIEKDDNRIYSLVKWYEGVFFLEVIACDKVAAIIPHLNGWKVFPYVYLAENIKSKFPKEEISTDELISFLSYIYLNN